MAGAHEDDGPTGSSRALVRTWAVRLVRLVLLAGLCTVPLTLSDYWIFEFTLVLIWGIAIMGLSILLGFNGQLSLGHAAFVGLGAYTGGLVSVKTSWPFWVELPTVIVFAIAAGIVVGLPALRVSGLRLALITLAFGSLFQWFIIHNQSLTGGTQGLFVDPVTFWRYDSTVPWHGYLFALFFAVIGSILMWQLPRTPLGRSMFAGRDSELAARSVGVSLTAAKLWAFVIAAIFGGVSGWMLGHHTGALSQTSFDLFQSINLLVSVIVGGAGSLLGAWLGALWLVLVPEAFRLVGSGRLFPVVSGFILVVVVLLAPAGVASLVRRGWDVVLGMARRAR